MVENQRGQSIHDSDDIAGRLVKKPRTDGCLDSCLQRLAHSPDRPSLAPGDISRGLVVVQRSTQLSVNVLAIGR